MRGKIARLAGKLLWAYSRILVLALPVAISLLVQLIVAKLFRASTEGFEDALENEGGTSEMIWAETSDMLGLDSQAFYEEIVPAWEPSAHRPIVVIENFGAITLLCSTAAGDYSSVSGGVALGADGTSADLPIRCGVPRSPRALPRWPKDLP